MPALLHRAVATQSVTKQTWTNDFHRMEKRSLLCAPPLDRSEATYLCNLFENWLLRHATTFMPPTHPAVPVSAHHRLTKRRNIVRCSLSATNAKGFVIPNSSHTINASSTALALNRHKVPKEEKISVAEHPPILHLHGENSLLTKYVTARCSSHASHVLRHMNVGLLHPHGNVVLNSTSRSSS